MISTAFPTMRLFTLIAILFVLLTNLTHAAPTTAMDTVDINAARGMARDLEPRVISSHSECFSSLRGFETLMR